MNKFLLHVAGVIIIIVDIPWFTWVYLIGFPNFIYSHIKSDLKTALLKLPHSKRKHLPYFDIYGLRFAQEHLNSIKIEEFITRELEEQAKYCDEQVILFCKEGQLSELEPTPFNPMDMGKDQQPTVATDPCGMEIHYRDINVTGIANAAYSALNHPKIEERVVAFDILNKIERTIRAANK